MKLSKLKTKQILQMSVIDEVIKEFSDDHANPYYLDNSPQNWTRKQTREFDMLSEVENRIQSRIIHLLNGQY